MPGGPLEVGYGVSYLSIAIPVLALQQPAVADRRWPTARGERAGGGRWGDWHALSPPRCEQHVCSPVSLP